MHKNCLHLIFVILCFYFALVFCEEAAPIGKDLQSKDLSHPTALREESRLRKKHFHHMYSLWGFYGLAVAYLVKIKVVVVAFLVGSAVYLGLRYWWPHKCIGGGDFYKEGSVILDHPPSFGHYDHIPYSAGYDHQHHHHHDDSISFSSSSGPAGFEPYAAYSSHSAEAAAADFPTGANGESLTSAGQNFRRKRSDFTDKQENQSITSSLESLARQMVVNEERIGDFMFAFLGLDSKPCRRRFICEMEFKSKENPLTAMAFRIIGRSFFGKYTNSQNPLGKANSFDECANVNAECVFIENTEETENPQQQMETMTADVDQELNTNENSLGNTDDLEKENENNLKTELRAHVYRRRVRGDRHLKLI